MELDPRNSDIRDDLAHGFSVAGALTYACLDPVRDDPEFVAVVDRLRAEGR